MLIAHENISINLLKDKEQNSQLGLTLHTRKFYAASSDTFINDDTLEITDSDNQLIHILLYNQDYWFYNTSSNQLFYQ